MRRPHLGSRATRLGFDSDHENVLATQAGRGLGCLRGVSTLTDFALAVEPGGWHRITGATTGSLVGLVPSEYPLRGLTSAGYALDAVVAYACILQATKGCTCSLRRS